MKLTFHKPALQLSIAYLALIMALSVGFSVVVYRISAGELNRGLHRQSVYFNQLTVPSFGNFDQYRIMQQAEETSRLKTNLLIFNVLVLILGGAGSYVLAKRTIRPIEQALDSQSRFAGDASHELRTPLAVMQTEIEVALRNTKLTPAEAHALLSSNLEEVAKLKTLTEGLLLLARQDGRELELLPVSLEAVAKEAIKRTAAAAEAKAIKVDLSLSAVSVMADSRSLAELVVTLLDNAIKYSADGQPVRITIGRQGKYGTLSIRDEGVGIKAADLPRIFERFYRTDSSRSKTEVDGYGLGLAIAKQIADLHHGAIDVRSAVGQGSTFTVRIPMVS